MPELYTLKEIITDVIEQGYLEEFLSNEKILSLNKKQLDEIHETINTIQQEKERKFDALTSIAFRIAKGEMVLKSVDYTTYFKSPITNSKLDTISYPNGKIKEVPLESVRATITNGKEVSYTTSETPINSTKPILNSKSGYISHPNGKIKEIKLEAIKPKSAKAALSHLIDEDLQKELDKSNNYKYK